MYVYYFVNLFLHHCFLLTVNYNIYINMVFVALRSVDVCDRDSRGSLVLLWTLQSNPTYSTSIYRYSLCCSMFFCRSHSAPVEKVTCTYNDQWDLSIAPPRTCQETRHYFRHHYTIVIIKTRGVFFIFIQLVGALRHRKTIYNRIWRCKTSRPNNNSDVVDITC